MIDLNKCKLLGNGSRMMNLASDVTNVEDGTLLIRVMENGNAVVKPSAGDDDEVVVGFALNNVTDATVAPSVVEVTVPSAAPYTVNLARTPNATPTVIINGTPATVAATAPTAAGEARYVGGVVTFHSGDAGKSVRVVYKYNLTAAEANALFGQTIGNAAGLIKATGVVHDADTIYISNYDSESNWWDADNAPVYSGEDGTVSLTNTGTELLGVYVESAPGANSPFLGLRVKL